MTLHAVYQSLKSSGQQFIITIDKIQILPLGHCYTRVTGFVDPCIFFMDNCDSFVVFSKLITYLSRIIRATIVNKNQFIVIKTLLKNTLDLRPQQLFRVVYWYNDRNFHFAQY